MSSDAVKSSRILCLEAAGSPGSAALATEAGMVAAAMLEGRMRHATELMPAVERLLNGQGWRADSITDVYLSIGPGSFTGLRLGVSIARTLAWAAGSRIVAVPTMDALARNALAADPVPEHVAILVDAKRGQAFAAAYRIDAGCCHRLIAACLAEPGEFLARCPRSLAVLGEGVPHHREAIAASSAAVLDPALWPGRAENVFGAGIELARAGAFTPARDLVPLYIRRPEMEERWEQHKRG